MKRVLTIFAVMFITALIFTGCSSYTRTGYRGGYYSHEYGDGQPDVYYYNYNQQPAVQVSIGFNDFYTQLSPYGSWVNIAPYGQVWVANVPNFQPYSTNGYWTYTTYGWTWVSNYSWGWAPFHYGRWGFNSRDGWYWVPGYEWGPAWVAWGSGADMYGWAPLMPGMNYRVSLSLNLFPSNYWTFMPGRYMGMTNIGNYYVNRSRNVTIIKNTTIINNYGMENNRRYTMGPTATDVQRYTGRSVQAISVTNVSDSRSAGVGSNELRVYRPVTRADDTQSNNRRATNSSDNNNAGASQTRSSQPAQQPANNAGASQTRSSQPAQQPANNAGASQTRSSQSSTQQDAGQSSYRANPSQPKVTNNAAPQT